MNWIFFSVIANVTATFFLKISAMHSSVLGSGKSVKIASIIAALYAYFFAFISYRQTLVSFQVGTAYALITSSTAILVGLMGAVVFGETISLNYIIGLLLICAGIILISIQTVSLNG
jgi:multidrug transporter EmrE-like cation transporter